MDTADPGGRQGVRYEAGRVIGIVDDVNLLAVQFVHHVPHPATHGADAGALGVDALLVGADRDLGAVARFPRDRDNLHRAAPDLRDFQREQLLHQARVGARQGD